MVSGISSSSIGNYLYQLQQSGSQSSSTQSGSDSSSTEDIFSAIDTDGDGSVSKSELSTFLTNMETQFANSVMNSQFGTSETDSSTENLFSAIDTDGDGSVSKSELSTFQSNMQAQGMGGPPPPPPDSSTQSSSDSSSTSGVFSAIDTNEDGSISPSELSAFLSGLDGTSSSSSSSTSSSTNQQKEVSALFSYMMDAISKYMASSQIGQTMASTITSAITA